MMEIWQKRAEELEENDPLAHYKAEFYFPENTNVYLDGNSLGLLSKRAEQAVYKQLDSWKKHGIDGWTQGENPWFYFSEQLSAKAAALVGAHAHEVSITGSITANLHQLLTTFYKPVQGRKNIVMEELAFPTDRYAVHSQLMHHGLNENHLSLISSNDGYTVDMDDILAAIDEQTALVLLPSVLYRSGQRLDWKVITDHAHQQGAVIGWDLAHSFGVMPHDLHDAGVDFAVWCTYKYANSGPGGTGGLFVHEKHHGTIPALAGWFGSDKEKQFDMSGEFSPAADASAFQMGTPNILSMTPLKGALEMIEEAGIDRIRSRSLKLTSFLRLGIEEAAADESALNIVTPSDGYGGHIAVSHPEAAKICRALKAKGIVPDFRAPDIIRLAPSPLYTSFHDIYETLAVIKELLETREFTKYKNTRGIIA
ncbi:kynureninase [Alkalicoccus daliensis]|uniref:Kynureninase n=1 Tax=Alkalicoccus daliensis TaxID=745820 RepID=A0A1H0DXU3_9BACI|nr:kynureninase [Alkalicoccus daliensis]SDN74980.1 Kynureninase [Alkalicoccus daliensis]